MAFTRGDKVFWKQSNCSERPASFVFESTDTHGKSYCRIKVDGEEMTVPPNEVFGPKKPGLGIRGLASVIGEDREAIQGEVIAFGIGPDNRRFFYLDFHESGGGRKWYSQDEVFIVSTPIEPKRDEFPVDAIFS